ncbi:MAG: energy transducer TonB [Bacteroidota bacterium]
MKREEKNIFSGDYLERYRTGALSSEEAHALEKSSLEDPLLAEALEGYQAAPRSSEPELTFLRQWVNERVEESQAAIRYIPKNRSFAPLLRVAAVFLVLIGSAWMAYVFWLQPDQKVMADRVQPTINKTPALVESETRTIQNPNQDEALHTEPAKIDVKTPDQEELKETPITQAEPVKVSVKQSDPIVSADNEPNRSTISPNPLPSKDEALKVVEDNTESVNAKSLKVQSENRQAPVYKLANDAKEENPVPAIGWTAYENYLSRNRESAPTPSNTQINHLVVLTFEVDKDGRPTDVKVKQSAGIPYDQKAQDLLKKGPGWIQGKINSRGELQVQF